MNLRGYVDSTHSVGTLISTKPFQFDSVTSVIQASGLAIFSFLGFDAITTLAEESVNPRRDVPKAMIICMLLGFAIMFVTGYLGVLALPNWQQLATNSNWSSVALFDLAKLTGGSKFAFIYTIGFILAMITSNLVGTAAVSRLLYGMGRDGVIPNKFFGAVNKRWKTPHWNIVFIILLELVLGSFFNIDQLAELINFGAISGFIILNICALKHGFKLQKEKTNIKYFVFPMVGLVIMFTIFFNMKLITLILGSFWGLMGILYYFNRKQMTPIQ